VVLVACGVIASIWLSLVYDIQANRRSTMAGEVRELKNIARVLAEQAARSLQSVDLVLETVDDWNRTTGHVGDPGGASRAELSAFLQLRMAGMPQIGALEILSPSGTLLYSNAGAAPAPAADPDREFESAPEGALGGEPTGLHAGLTFARVLHEPGGRSPGRVRARISPDYFEAFYQAIALGPDSSIGLYRADGALLARYPAEGRPGGTPFAALPAALPPTLQDQAEPVVLNLPSPVDGRDRLRAVAPVRGFPMVVAVSRDLGALQQPWEQAALDSVLRALAVSLVMGLLALVLVRVLRRRDDTLDALRLSEERLQAVLVGSNEGYWDWDLRTGRVDLSERMKVLSGIPAAQVITTREAWLLADRRHPEDRVRMEAALRAHLAGQTPTFEVEYRVGEGSTLRWLHASGSCFRDGEGRPERVAGSVRDITARKLAEQERESLELQLRRSQKLEAIGTLAGGIAHDFNNILGAILGYTEMAQRAASGQPLLGRYLDHIANAGTRARELVDRILTFSRSGMARRIPFHLGAAVEEALDLMRASLPARIRLESALEAGDASVTGDATEIHQVVMNLCTNAIQAMPAEGLLRVALAREHLETERRMTSAVLAPGDYVRLEVSDTGCGIDPKLIDRLFDPFFTTKPVGVGTGLGLSLVHGIVGEMNGAIDVHSRPGAGTTFSVYLPAGPDIARLSTAAPAAPLGSGRGQTVLVVDDEPVLVALGEEMLAALGYEPVGFVGSREALRAFRAQPGRFDAVLTDETMPELSGTALARELHALRPELPVVLMSGYGDPALRQRAAEAGVCEILRKPLKLEDIARVMDRVLG
jgi:PAS domain S-box-containing protein